MQARILAMLWWQWAPAAAQSRLTAAPTASSSGVWRIVPKGVCRTQKRHVQKCHVHMLCLEWYGAVLARLEVLQLCLVPKHPSHCCCALTLCRPWLCRGVTAICSSNKASQQLWATGRDGQVACLHSRKGTQLQKFKGSKHGATAAALSAGGCVSAQTVCMVCAAPSVVSAFARFQLRCRRDCYLCAALLAT
jgi:hypothetical protein